MNVERINELTNMKALRYLLIVVMLSVASIWGVAYATAQGLAKQPKTEMRSTSVMPGAGSGLPSAAVSGAVLTGNTPGTYSPANSTYRGPNKGKKVSDDDSPGTEPGQEEDTPLGDAALPLALLALVYAGYKVRRRMHA